MFSHEKFFDINDVYNSENESVWAINCADVDEDEVVLCGNKIFQRESDDVVECLLFQGLVILDEGTVEIIVASSKTHFL